MPVRLLLGNEALAQGALDAGLSSAYAYPGTPSTEITEHLRRSAAVRSGEVIATWTANEKTALEAALGASYAGVRALATMKHVGLNVAADPFMNAAIAGANGGLIVVVADDPSMHSSQNEQDSRVYAEFAFVPCIEPADQQEAYEAPALAFDLSERQRIPVLIRLTTRLSHSRATVEVQEDARLRNGLRDPEMPKRFIVLPALARVSYADLLRRQPDVVAESEASPLTTFIDGEDRSLGVIACGSAYTYLREVADDGFPHPILKIGQYPLPESLISRLISSCDRILVLEDGYPVVESKLVGMPRRRIPTINGRLNGTVPRTGELTADLVADALAIDRPAALAESTIPAARPPALCPGCPHGDTSNALKEALAPHRETARVFSDIGCYTLAALPPYSVIDTCVEMGASITMAKGAAQAGLHPAIALLGDSTFTHSGMTGLLDCVNENADVTVVIVDNLTVAMTGGQPSSAETRLVSICRGLGVDPDHIRVIGAIAGKHEGNVAVLAEEISHPGPSVVIAQRECIQTARRRTRAARTEEVSA